MYQTLSYTPEIQVWIDLWPHEAYTNSSESVKTQMKVKYVKTK